MFTETCEAPKEISCYSLNHSTQQVESKDCITREEKKKKKPNIAWLASLSNRKGNYCCHYTISSHWRASSDHTGIDVDPLNITDTGMEPCRQINRTDKANHKYAFHNFVLGARRILGCFVEDELNQKGKQQMSAWKYQNRNTSAAVGNNGTAKALPDLKGM